MDEQAFGEPVLSQEWTGLAVTGPDNRLEEGLDE